MSSGFISESEIAEKRRVRQEEWEKVRQPHQPLEAPEEEYDHRSLYERLQEQKQKKEFEYEEAHRLKNMIKGLDDDEVEFLDLVDRSKLEEERKKTAEEEREMADFRNKVASLQEKSLEERIQQEIRQPLRMGNSVSSGRTSQTKLLAGAVVKKKSLEAKPMEQSMKTESKEKGIKRSYPEGNGSSSQTVGTKRSFSETDEDVDVKRPTGASGLRCIGILPGLGTYENSSEEDSDESTDMDEEVACHRFDLLGREVKKKIKVTVE